MNPLTRTVYAGYRDSVAFTGPAQSGKTSALIRVALDLPGALFSASTRGHLAEATVTARSSKGPVWLADPCGEGGFPTNLICSPLSGCRDYRVATDSAGELIQAMPRDTNNTGVWWDRKGAQWLKLAMHAAAWEPGSTMTDVRAWAGDRDLWDVPVKILAACPHAAPGWAMAMHRMCRSADGDLTYFQNVSSTVDTALDWLSDPAMDAIAGGPPGEDGELRPGEFLLSNGTLHLVAANKPHNPVSPYFAWLLSYVFNAGKRIAAGRPGKILNPPCAIMLDEPLASCRARLSEMIVEAAGWGFPFFAGFQSFPSQLAEAWGEQAAKTISNNLTWQVYLGGTQEPEHLERVSAMGGDEEREDRRTGATAKRRTFTPGRINLLKQGEVLVKPRAGRAFIGRIPRAEDHPLFVKAGPGDWPAVAPSRRRDRLAARPALEPARRGPIAPPYTPPAVTEAAPVPALTAEEVPACRT